MTYFLNCHLSIGYCACGIFFPTAKELKFHQTTCEPGFGYGQPRGVHGASVNLSSAKSPENVLNGIKL